MKLEIKVLRGNILLPSKATNGSAGFDIHWSLPESILTPGSTYNVDLGFATSFPENCGAIMLPRSGLGSKHGLKLNNTIGLIDSDYRGEWKAAITVDKPLRLSPGDRFLQFTMVTVPEMKVTITECLDETERGSGGFGHTGK